MLTVLLVYFRSRGPVYRLALLRKCDILSRSELYFDNSGFSFLNFKTLPLGKAVCHLHSW